MYRYEREFPFQGPGPRYGGGYRPRPPVRRWTDRDTWMSVRQTLFEDTWLDARDIGIEVERGVVTLTGTVRDHMAARYAWDDAWESEGVRGVISRLEVDGADTDQEAAGAADPPEPASEDLAS